MELELPAISRQLSAKLRTGERCFASGTVGWKSIPVVLRYRSKMGDSRVGQRSVGLDRIVEGRRNY